MAKGNTAVTPLLTHWSYCILALSHRYNDGGGVVKLTYSSINHGDCLQYCTIDPIEFVKKHTVFVCNINIHNVNSARVTAIHCRQTNGYCWEVHYGDVIMSAMASQITSLTIVYSTVYSGADQRKHIKLRITGLCEGKSPVTGEFPTKRVSNAENVSIWWRHHETAPETMWTVAFAWDQFHKQCSWT